MTKRRMWIAGGALALAALVAVSGYEGVRVGRRFERNQMCCDLPVSRNAVVSIREVLGLLRFPSQIGQDRWVSEKIFPGVRDGFFLDVGSADGYFFSNTWALEQRGWKGICVDPFPKNMGGRTCTMFKDAVDSVSGRAIVFKQAGDLGGISDYLSDRNTDARAAHEVTLSTVTLADILQRASAPPFIHFMSLDVEGAELEALRGFPFDRYRLGALAVEHNCEEPKRSDIRRLLGDHRYDLARSWMQDDFYLPRQR